MMSNVGHPSSVRSVSFIGLRGMEGCETLALHEFLTGFVGRPGSGKTTLLKFFIYAMLPDAKVLHLRELANLGGAPGEELSALLGAISPEYGYAIVALDTMLEGARTVLGIQIQPDGGGIDITRWTIRSKLGADQQVRELFAIADGDFIFYPPIQELRRHLAGKGVALVPCSSVSEYARVLFDAGIIPSPLSSNQDKRLFAKLLEATFIGGLSNDVVVKLKDYLLPPPSSFTDLIDGLQGCLQDVMKTRAAIRDNERELDLLGSTYRAGRDAVCAALGAMRYEIARMMDREAHLADAAIAEEARKASAYVQLTAEEFRLTELEQEWHRAKSKAQMSIVRMAGRLAVLERDDQAQVAAVGELTDLLDRIRHGSKVWGRIARGCPIIEAGQLLELMDAQLALAAQECAAIESSLARAESELHRLRHGLGSPAIEHAAELVGGMSIEAALAKMDDSAVAPRLAGLRGRLEGIVGVDCASVQLSSLDAELGVLWIGQHLPLEQDVRHDDGWLRIASPSGEYVLSESFVASLSRAGRQSRLLRTEGSASAMQVRLRRSERMSRALRLRRRLWFDNLGAMAALCSHWREEGELQLRLINARNAHERVRRMCGKLLAAIAMRNEVAPTIAGKYEPEVKAIRDRLTTLRKSVNEAELRISHSREELQRLEGERLSRQEQTKQAELNLGPENAWLYAEIGRFSATAFSTKDQSNRLYTLRSSLGPAALSRIGALAEDPNDHLAIVRMWPLLAQITAESVSLAATGTSNEDLFERTRAQRTALDRKLAEQEEELRINCRAIRFSIESTIVTQRHRMEKLGKFGKSICFGNVTGIQMRMQERESMLSILQKTEELPLRTDPDVSVFNVLADFFKQYDRHCTLTGEELLDYRNYVDLTIEIQRKDGAWTPTYGVSATEAIGSGVAFALMLYRGLAMQSSGGRKVAGGAGLNPVFVIDEIARIEVEQDVLIEFAQREGFKVLVSSQSMKPSLPCQLYDLSRQYEPHESLTIRAIELLK